MKKFLASVLIMMMMMVSVGNISALTYDESYLAAKSYYGKKTVLQGADEVIAYESLGLESDALTIEYVVDSKYASTIAKTVIALTLHGDDPRNYEGVNYVEMLEKCVQENGAFDKENTVVLANYQVYGVYALYVVDSPKVEQAADYLVSLVNQDYAWGYGGASSSDLTGWVIEALTLVNRDKYQPVIEKALTYIQSKQEATGGYNDAIDEYYTANANTQACVLMGLLTYDSEGVKANKYNQGENNPYDFLLTFQNNDGSFWYTEAGEDNYIATLQGIQAVGYYYQGSVYQTAYQNYQKLLNPVVEDEKEPVKEPEEVKQPEKEIVKEEKKKVVETSDLSQELGYLCLLGLSIVGLLKGKQYVE